MIMRASETDTPANSSSQYTQFCDVVIYQFHQIKSNTRFAMALQF